MDGIQEAGMIRTILNSRSTRVSQAHGLVPSLLTRETSLYIITKNIKVNVTSTHLELQIIL